MYNKTLVIYLIIYSTKNNNLQNRKQNVSLIFLNIFLDKIEIKI